MIMPTVNVGGRAFAVLFPDLLRPLEDGERRALKDSILARGVVVPVVVDEDDGIIDGGNRATLAAELGLAELPLDVRPGLTPEQKLQLAYDLNDARRHLTPAQRQTLRDDRVRRVADLRRQGLSLRAIAAEVEVSLPQVQRDLRAAATVSGDTVEPAAGKVVGRGGPCRPAHRPVPDKPAAPPVVRVLPAEDNRPEPATAYVFSRPQNAASNNPPGFLPKPITPQQHQRLAADLREAKGRLEDIHDVLSRAFGPFPGTGETQAAEQAQRDLDRLRCKLIARWSGSGQGRGIDNSPYEDRTPAEPRLLAVNGEDENEDGDGPIPRAIQLAHEAIRCLERIPENDAFRDRAFEIVTDWIRRNG